MRAPFLTPVAVVFLVVASRGVRAEPPQREIKHEGPVFSVVWSTDGKTLVSAGQDGIIRLTDVASGKETKRIDTKHAVRGIALSPDGKLLAVRAVAGTLELWSVENGNLMKTNTLKNYTGHHLAFFSDGSAITAVGVGEKQVWHHLKGGASGSKTAGNLTGCAAVSPDGTKTVTTIGTAGLLRMYEYDGKLWRLRPLQIKNARAVAFSPDGKTLAVANADNTIDLWDYTTNQNIRKYEGLREPAVHLAFSGNGKTFAAIGSTDTTIRVWDADTARLRRQLVTNRANIAHLALSPDGRQIATAGNDGKALVWSVAARDLGKLGPPIELSAKDLDSLWRDLANADLTKADEAFKKLVRGGDSSVPYLAQQIRAVAVPLVEAKQIDNLLKDLDSENFGVREKASKELARFGELAVGPLQKLLDSNPTPEARRRATLLLEKLKAPALSPERLRALEAVELLEHIRTAEARKVLEEIARTALIAQIQREARDALERLKRPGDSLP